MELMDALRSAIQDRIIPEIDKLHLENAEIRATLGLTNKRLDDIQQQLLDQSRRIDETNQRIDETNKRIDGVHADMIRRFDETHDRFNRLYEVIVRGGTSTSAWKTGCANSTARFRISTAGWLFERARGVARARRAHRSAATAARSLPDA